MLKKVILSILVMWVIGLTPAVWYFFGHEELTGFEYNAMLLALYIAWRVTPAPKREDGK